VSSGQPGAVDVFLAETVFMDLIFTGAPGWPGPGGPGGPGGGQPRPDGV